MVWSVIASSFFESKAQEKAAGKQIDAIREAAKIGQEAVNAAVKNALSIANPALANSFESSQNVIDLFNQGRVSSGNLIAQGFDNAVNTLNQGGQNALNALLGVSSPQVQQSQTDAPVTSVSQPQAQDFGQVTTNIGDQQVTIPTGGTQFATDPNTGQQVPIRQPGDIEYGPLRPVNAPAQSPRPLGGQPVAEFRDAPRQPPRTQQTQDPSAPIVLGEDALVNPQQLQTNFGQRDLNLTQAQLPQLPEGTTAGLRGTEQAVTQGLDTARTDLGMGATLGLQSQARRFGQAADELRSGQDFALNRINQAIQQSQQGYDRAAADVLAGTDRAASTALGGAQQAVGFLSPYIQSGAAVQDRLLGLSGARGQEAFDEALLNDPAYQLALERSEQSLGRQAALTGGIGGGNIAAELQRNAQLQAAADVDRQIGRLFNISEAGRGAASTAGGFTTQAGISAGNIQAGGAQSAAGLRARGLDQATGLNTLAAQTGLQTSQDISRLASQLGLSEQQVLNQLGQNLGQAALQTGSQLGQVRQTAGQQAANLINQQAGQQAGLQTGGATALSNLDQQTLANIANTIGQADANQLNTRLGLANLLANIGIGQGNQQVALQQQLGTAQAAGVTNPIGNALSGITGLYAGLIGNAGVG